jgi:hypothetical protein
MPGKKHLIKVKTIKVVTCQVHADPEAQKVCKFFKPSYYNFGAVYPHKENPCTYLAGNSCNYHLIMKKQ